MDRSKYSLVIIFLYVEESPREGLRIGRLRDVEVGGGGVETMSDLRTPNLPEPKISRLPSLTRARAKRCQACGRSRRGRTPDASRSCSKTGWQAGERQVVHVDSSYIRSQVLDHQAQTKHAIKPTPAVEFSSSPSSASNHPRNRVADCGASFVAVQSTNISVAATVNHLVAWARSGGKCSYLQTLKLSGLLQCNPEPRQPR